MLRFTVVDWLFSEGRFFRGKWTGGGGGGGVTFLAQ